MKHLTLLFSIVIVTNINYAQTGPGGVGSSTNNKIWYDAFQQNLTNGSSVSTLTDFSGNSNDATQSNSSNRPTFQTNQANGMPAINFDGTNDFLEITSISDLETNNLTWFAISKTSLIHTGVIIRNAYNSGAGVGSSQMWGSYVHTANSQYNSHVRRSNSNIIGGVVGFNTNFNILTNIWNGSSQIFNRYFNGTLISTSTLANAVPTGHIRTRIGADSQSSPAYFFNGKISEIIVYTQVLNETQRIIIENYLGNKYGISFSNDFYAYENTHPYEIAGIGQTSASDNHLTSKGSSIIEISNPSSISNGSFLLWGHDNSAMSPQVGDVPAGYGTRLTRNWRVDKTGSIGNVTVRIDISSISWADPTSYALLIDDDGTFSNATAIPSSGFDGTYLTFNGVTLNDGDYITLASTATDVDIISITSGNWESNSTWNCGCVPGTGANVTIDNGHTVTLNSNRSTKDLTINSTGTLTVNGSFNLTIEGNLLVDGTFNPGTGTVIYNSSSTQTIAPINYYNLTSTGTGSRILSSSGTIGIAGTFTPGTNSYTITGSTINFNGTGTQTIPAFNYNNLTSSNTGARILASSGTIGIAGTFTPGTNSYTITGSTINFNGSGTQTIPAFNYNNLTSSNTGARILASSGTIGIAGVFTKGSNTYTTTGSTVEFNGSGSQNIPGFNYFNLTSSNTGTRSISSQIINIAGTFNPGTNTYNISNSAVNFNGNSPQTIPAFTYFDLRTSGSGTKTFDTSNPINIQRDLTFQSTATIVATNSTIILNGTVNQTISSPNSTTVELNNLTINKSSGGVFLANTTNATYRLRGALAINSATNFNTNGKTFILVSDSISTARIAPVAPGGSITGNFTIQRFIASGSNGWRTMGAPATTTVADWDNELLLSGVGGGEGFFPGDPFYSIYKYDESIPDYVNITSTSTTLSPGTGYEVWICGPTYDDTGSFSNIVLTTISNPYVGDLNLTVYNTGDGYNLIANPFASHIDLDLITGGDIETTFYIFDEDIGSPDYYAFWDSGSQTGTGDLASSNGIIPAHQGFWVYANSTSTITIPESAKTTTNTSNFVGKQELPELSVRINKQNSPKGSRAFIRFNDVSTKNFDEYDKQFHLPVPPNIPTISFITDENKKLIVNSVNEYENNYSLPFSIKSGSQGIYQISVNKQNIINGYNCYMIEDKKLNKIVNVSDGAYYEVALNNNEKIDNRFILHISKDDCPASEAPSGIYNSAIENKVGVFGHEQGAVVVFGYSETVKANISVYNTLGQLISQPLSQNISSDRVILNLPATTQVYIIKVEVNGEILTQRIVR
ncbi:MAG: G8 domain-containing protein [Bacteroidia bacterium]